MSNHTIGSTLFLFLLGSCQAQQPEERTSTGATSRKRTPGVSSTERRWCTIQEDVYQGALGIGSIDPVDSLDLNAQFRLASVSKQFTAMAIMLLKEQGKLKYDQDIRDFIPELPWGGTPEGTCCTMFPACRITSH
ncbi:MAG: serine hydrolase [Flavobacteriales bacterium]|nr:serine hydrolase [Flavobacteriales bacterium]